MHDAAAVMRVARSPIGEGSGMLRKTITVIAITALLLTDAEGASLMNVQGAVTVSNGSGVIRASEGLPLPAGAVVHTGEGAANIAYENGCVVRVGPREAVSVAYAPPSCDGGAFDFSSIFGDMSTGDILIDAAVVLGLVVIILVATLPHSKSSTSSTTSTTSTSTSSGRTAK